MANYFEKPYFDKQFYDKPFFGGDYFKLPFFTGIGTTGDTIIVEDEPFDLIVGSFATDGGYDKHLGIGSLPVKVVIDGKTLDSLFVNHSTRIFTADFSGSLGVFNASSIDVTLGGTGQGITLDWDSATKSYKTESVIAVNYFTVNNGDTLGFIIHSNTSPPPPEDEAPVKKPRVKRKPKNAKK